MADADQKLFERLTEKHPVYEAHEDEWRLYSDVIGDTEMDKRRYLPKGQFEDPGPYADRLMLAEMTPESDRPIQKIVDAIYSQKHQRDTQQEHDGFLENADGQKTEWTEYIETVLETMLAYGCVRLLVNRRRVSPDSDEFLTYCVNYSPLDVTHWVTDDFHALEMVRICEDGFDVIDGDPRETVRIIQYTREDSSEWLFAKRRDKTGLQGDWELIYEQEGVPHDLRMVPMVFAGYPRNTVPGVGKGMLKKIARCDLRAMRAQSDLSYDAYLHAHPTIVYVGDGDLQQVQVGSTAINKIAHEEDLRYLELPKSTAEVQQDIIQRNLEAIDRHAGTDPLGQAAGESIYGASGRARAWSFSTSEQRILKRIASKMQRVEEAVFEIHDRWNNSAQNPGPEKTVTKVKIEYANDYSPDSVDQLLELMERGQTRIESEKYWLEIQKRFVASTLGDSDMGLIRQIEKEMEAGLERRSQEREELRRLPAPQFPPGDDPAMEHSPEMGLP